MHVIVTLTSIQDGQGVNIIPFPHFVIAQHPRLVPGSANENGIPL